MSEKTLAKIVFHTLNILTVGFGFALFISVGSMIEALAFNKACLIVAIISIVWIIAYGLFIKYLNRR